MKARAKTSQQVPLNIVGSDKYGRYPKISVERSINMFVADDFIVNFAGYQEAVDIGGQGRGLFVSTRANLMFAVSGNSFYSIDTNLGKVFLGNIDTLSGDIFMAEDLQHNIAICDRLHIYLYNYANPNGLQIAYTNNVGNPLDFQPTHISMQDGRFIATDTQGSQWRLSDPTSGNLNFPNTSAFVGNFQSKPDAPIATVPMPSRGNTLLVIGSNHAESWFDVGAQLFPYQKNTSFNIDYGCVNPATIASLDNLVAWIGINEKTGPVIIFSDGQDARQISTDGINYKLATLQNPELSYGLMFRQDGHLFYVATFYDFNDNFSVAYDFTTKLFYTLTDEEQNYFIAQNCVSFNNTYYFISINDGNMYELNSAFTTYTYKNKDTTLRIEQIPRIRICKTFRTSDGTPFITNSVAFPLEQGNDPNSLQNIVPVIQALATENLNGIAEENTNYAIGLEYDVNAALGVHTYQPAVDLAISIDGGDTFSNFVRMNMNPLGYRKNRFVYYGLGYANEMTPQFRFHSNFRIVATDGVMNVYG